MDIGFIGLGNMGFHMARRLLAAGHTVIALDTRKDVLDRMVALGASPAGSPKEVADRAETVMASLPTPDIVVQVDAPVSGGVSGAEKGTLAVMASGPRAEVAAVEPALAVIGKVFHIGEQPGAGQTMKLANNFLSATAMAATAEAMVMGVKAGLDPRVMLDVINSGSGRNTATETKFPRNVLPGTFDLGFTNGLMAKDVGLALAEAKALGVPMEVAEAVMRQLRRACEEIGPNQDLTTIVQPLERRVGVEVREKKK
jgi:3-hydroxyisobutyrate dehydrogenase-like beta-hydroxyacid dehydrogenase